jgi:hypothetical protein
MFKKLLPYILLLVVTALPYFYQLGNDMVALDDFHFKNWSYVFMKEFEAGNYDRLYVSVQPGVLTIYSNILGFKGLYFAKDKFGLVSATGKQFDLLLHTAQKLPKAVLSVVLLLVIVKVLAQVTNKKVAFLFGLLFSLEPYLIGQVRVIQTDALPMYLSFLALLLLYQYRTTETTHKHWYLRFILLGFLTGSCIVEKSLYFTLALVVCCELVYRLVTDKNRKTNLCELFFYCASTFLTMIMLFPAFWDDFFFTLYRITIGSFIFGIQGLDTETFSYAKTNHLQSNIYYFRFILNKVSEFVWLGLGLFVAYLYKQKPKLTKNLLPAIIFPLLSFLVLVIAEKKIGRYTILLWPYLILLATAGYTKFIQSRKLLIFVVSVFLLTRLCQFWNLFPDYLMYKNILSPDIAYDNSLEAWGSGRKKLADYISTSYGSTLKIYATDYTTLYLFYPGEVLNLDELQCKNPYGLVISRSSGELLCGRPLVPSDSYTPYSDLTFYIYRH